MVSKSETSSAMVSTLSLSTLSSCWQEASLCWILFLSSLFYFLCHSSLIVNLPLSRIFRDFSLMQEKLILNAQISHDGPSVLTEAELRSMFYFLGAKVIHMHKDRHTMIKLLKKKKKKKKCKHVSLVHAAHKYNMQFLTSLFPLLYWLYVVFPVVSFCFAFCFCLPF